MLGIFDGVDLSHLQREGKKPRQDELQHQKRALVAVELLSIKRTLKPLADAQETQRRERVQLLGDAAEALAIPRSYVQAPPRPAAADLFHKPNYQLQALRSDIPLPAHSTIQQYRLQQAPLDGTETRTFVTQRDGADIHVSYLADPQLFILKHVAQSKWLAVGADRGGPATKIGVTYERHGHMTYAPLVVCATVRCRPLAKLRHPCTSAPVQSTAPIAATCLALCFSIFVNDHDSQVTDKITASNNVTATS